MGAPKIGPEVLADGAKQVAVWDATRRKGQVIKVQFAGRVAGRAAPVAEATTSTLLKGLLRGAGVVASVVTLPGDQSERWKPYVEPPKPDAVCRVVDGHVVDDPSPADNLKFLTDPNQNISPLAHPLLTARVPLAADDGYRPMSEADVELTNKLLRLNQLKAMRNNGLGNSADDAEIAALEMQIASLPRHASPTASGVANPMASTGSSPGGSGGPVSKAELEGKMREKLKGIWRNRLTDETISDAFRILPTLLQTGFSEAHIFSFLITCCFIGIKEGEDKDKFFEDLSLAVEEAIKSGLSHERILYLFDQFSRVTPRPSLETLLVTLTAERTPEAIASQVKDFVTGTMEGDAKRTFVFNLRTDRDLRLACIRKREELPAGMVAVSEQAAAALDKVMGHLHDARYHSPGSRSVAGIEGRDYTVKDRDKAYDRAIELAEKALTDYDGELADLFIENAEVARINKGVAHRKTPARGSGSSREAFGGAIGALFGAPNPITTEGYHESVDLRLQKPQAVSLNELSRLDYDNDPAAVATFIATLPSAYPDRDDFSFYPSLYAEESFDAAFKAKTLPPIVARSLAVRRALARWVEAPLTGDNIDDQVKGKTVAAFLLLNHFTATGEPDSLQPLVDAFSRSLATDAKSRQGIYYEDGLLCLLASAAATSDQVWQGIKGALLGQIRKGHYGRPEKTRYQTTGTDRVSPTYVEALALLGPRNATDRELGDFVRKMATSSDPELQKASAGAVFYLSPAEAVPFYLNHLFSKGRLLSGDVAEAAVRELKKMPPDALRAVRFNGKQIHPSLKGTDNLADAVEKILRAKIEESDSPLRRVSVDLHELLELLYILEPARGVAMLKLVLQEGAWYRDLIHICAFARDHNLRDFSDDFLDILKKGASGEIHTVIDSWKDIFWLMREWGYSRRAIDDAVLDYCLKEGRSVSETAVRYFGFYGIDQEREPSRRDVDLVVKAVKGENIDVAGLGLRALRQSKHLLRFLTQEDVGVVVAALADDSKSDGARETLGSWLQIPQTRQLVLNEWSRRTASLASSGPDGDRILGELTQLLYLHQSSSAQLEGLDGPQAYHLFLYYRLPLLVYGLFIDSLGKDESSRTRHETEAHRLVEGMMGDQFEPMETFLLASMPSDEAGRNQWRESMKKVYGVIFGSYTPDPLSQLNVASFGLTRPDLNATSPVYRSLSDLFAEAWKKQACRRFSGLDEEEIAFIAAALMRQGRISEAEQLLKDHPVTDPALLGNIAYCASLHMHERESPEN